ncbi:ComF family protein [Stakelama flava]|uniref:ComF family protein n=1 Tax=Stakelama flava TaxID=2860338 RepID=UPI0031BA187B
MQTLREAVAFALPPRCPSCGAITEADHRLCAACWSALDFPGEPACARCNLPFEYDRGPGTECAACMAEPPLHDGIHAAVAYGEVSRAIMLKLKYGRRTAHAETAARLIARTLPRTADLIVPVPLHTSRIWSRGFNQAALIAQGLARQCDIPFVCDALVRTRRTPVLRGMGPKARHTVLAGAFAVHPRWTERIAGKAILLVDDVYTSGATSDACIRVLKRAGAKNVAIAAFARVLPEESGD